MWRCALVCLVACGRIGFDELARGADATLTTYRDVVVADQPLAYWRFDDVTAVAADEMGAYAGTYAGSCARAAGALAGDASQGLAMDGATCEIKFGDVLAFPGQQPFTIEVWVNEQTAAVDEIYWMKETRQSGRPLDGYALLNSPTTGVYLERIVNLGGENTARAPIPKGQWVYVVATYDGAQEHLYVDAAELGAGQNDTLSLRTYSAPCALGAFPPPISNAVHGELDEFAIYDHALSPQRIAVHRDYAVNGPR